MDSENIEGKLDFVHSLQFDAWVSEIENNIIWTPTRPGSLALVMFGCMSIDPKNVLDNKKYILINSDFRK